MKRRQRIGLGVALLVGAAVVGTKLLTGLGPVAAVTWVRCDLANQSGHPCSIVPELDALCRVASAAADGDDAAAEQTRAALESSLETRRGRHLLAAVMRAHPEQRGRILHAAAEASGAPGWTCPALEHLLGPRTPPASAP